MKFVLFCALLFRPRWVSPFSTVSVISFALLGRYPIGLRGSNDSNNMEIVVNAQLDDERVASLFAWVSLAMRGVPKYNNLMLAIVAIFGNMPPESLPVRMAEEARKILPSEEELVGDDISIEEREYNSLGYAILLVYFLWIIRLGICHHPYLDFLCELVIQCNGISTVDRTIQNSPARVTGVEKSHYNRWLGDLSSQGLPANNQAGFRAELYGNDKAYKGRCAGPSLVSCLLSLCRGTRSAITFQYVRRWSFFRCPCRSSESIYRYNKDDRGYTRVSKCDNKQSYCNRTWGTFDFRFLKEIDFVSEAFLIVFFDNPYHEISQAGSKREYNSWPVVLCERRSSEKLRLVS